MCFIFEVTRRAGGPRGSQARLTEHGEHHTLLDDENLVSAYLQHFKTKDDELFGAWQLLHDYITTEPQRAWKITLQLIEAADESALAYVAAGSLEDLLYSRAERCVDDVEHLARADPKFLCALRLINGPFTKESDASNRIQRAAGVPIQFIDDEWLSCNSNHQPNDNE